MGTEGQGHLSADSAAQVYTDFVATQLAEQERTRGSLDSRASVVVNSSAALTTLLLGLATLGASGDVSAVHLRPWSSGLIGGAVVLYAIAAIRAVMLMRPRDYAGPRVDHLRGVADDFWEGPTAEALRATYDAMLEMLAQAKESNREKAEGLSRAIWWEVAGTAVLAIGAVVTLLGG